MPADPPAGLAAEVMGGYLVLEVREDPVGLQEDPRAVPTLREFYVQERQPPGLREET